MFLTDKQIADHAILDPFVPQLIRGGLSYGLSSCGYDIRLSSEDVKIFRHIPGKVVDVKNFDSNFLEDADIQQINSCVVEDNDHTCHTATYFILPANSYALGVSLEHFTMPNDVFGICVGKSTYARAGIIVNITPLEPSWQGYLTIEISNSSSSDCRVYLNEGIAQILFYKLDEVPSAVYGDRKYQNQKKVVTFPKIV